MDAVPTKAPGGGEGAAGGRGRPGGQGCGWWEGGGLCRGAWSRDKANCSATCCCFIYKQYPAWDEGGRVLVRVYYTIVGGKGGWLQGYGLWGMWGLVTGTTSLMVPTHFDNAVQPGDSVMVEAVATGIGAFG